MAVEPVVLAEKPADQVIGQPRRHGEQRAFVEGPRRRYGGLDQVPGAVKFVARLESRVARRPADLAIRVQVAIGLLCLREQRRRFRGELGQGSGRRPGEFPAHGFQRLVDVGIHEHRAAIRAAHAADRQSHVVEVPGDFELPQCQRQARRPVTLPPVAEQPGGDLRTRSVERAVRDRRACRRTYRSAGQHRFVAFGHVRSDPRKSYGIGKNISVIQ
jgi:hypothetical protein